MRSTRAEKLSDAVVTPLVDADAEDVAVISLVEEDGESSIVGISSPTSDQPMRTLIRTLGRSALGAARWPCAPDARSVDGTPALTCVPVPAPAPAAPPAPSAATAAAGVGKFSSSSKNIDDPVLVNPDPTDVLSPASMAGDGGGVGVQTRWSLYS